MKPNAVLVRFAEVFLKRGRRPYFMSKLRQSLERQVSAVGEFRVREDYGFLTVLARGASLPDAPDIEVTPELRAAIERVFGIVSYSPARLVAREISQIEAAMEVIADEDVRGAASFKVDATRSDKDFPLNSLELNLRLGGLIWTRVGGMPVKMKDPAVTVHLQILPKHAAIFLKNERGPGGLPVGSSGRVLLLLSGGIDSPVAGWMTMRRGCELDAVHFEAAPYTTPGARKKVETLARMIATYEPTMKLYVVPFGGLQAEFRDHAPGRLLVILYRRMMLRIAERIAHRDGQQALVSGENLGQVASQTLENLAAIGAATTMPLLRPLIMNDKNDTIALAKRIGTFDTSILPFDDCCSLFVPPHPETKARIDYVVDLEKRFDLEAMMASAIAATEVIQI